MVPVPSGGQFLGPLSKVRLSLSSLFSSWIPMRFNLFSSLKTRKSFFSAFLSALFFTWPLASEAQLTQSDIVQAIHTALGSAPSGVIVNGSGYLFEVPFMFPSGATLGEWLMAHVSGGAPYQPPAYGTLADQISAIREKVLTLGSSGSAWTTNDVESLLTALDTLASLSADLSGLRSSTEGIAGDISGYQDSLDQLTGLIDNGNLLVKVDSLTFEDSSALVYDDAVYHKVDDVEDIIAEVRLTLDDLFLQIDADSSTLGDAATYLAGLSEDVGYIRSDVADSTVALVGMTSLVERIERTSRFIATNLYQMVDDNGEAERVYNDSYSDTVEENDDASEQAESDYEEIDFPTVEGSYTPDTSGMTDEPSQFSDMGFDQSTPNQHNALVTLVPYRRDSPGLLPAVEIDFGRDSAVVNATSQFAPWFGWMYRLFGTVLLSAKGLSMFRKCRLASEATAILAKPEPMTTLAWDPF